MKIRLLFTLAGLAIGFAAPVLAQEQNTVDPEVRQQIEAVAMKFDEAYKQDAAALAALYTQNAVQVWGWESGSGAVSGQQAIEKVCERARGGYDRPCKQASSSGVSGRR
jgi:hypothetical protein